MKGKRPVSRLEVGLLVAILLAAAVLRMGWPGLTEFKRDEAQLMSLALDMAEFRQFHVRGISSSVGLPNFPASAWLYALPLLLWRHVYAAVLFTGLLNVFAVLGCWWVVRRYWGSTAALTAAAMFAVSPWAVFHSRKIWAQDLLPPLVMAWGVSAMLAFVERRQRFVVLHLLSLAAALQVHLAGIALLPGTALLLLVFRRRLNWRLVLIGAGLAIATTLPYLRFLLTGSGPSLDAALNTLGTMDREPDLTAWRYAWLVGTGAEIHALAGPETFAEFLERAPDRLLVHALWGAMMIGGLLELARQGWSGIVGRQGGHRRSRMLPALSEQALFKRHEPSSADKRAARSRQSEVALVVLLWLLLPPLVFTLPLLPVELHYLLPIYPAQYVAAGVLFAVLIARLGRWRWLGYSALLASIVVQGVTWLMLLFFVSERSTPGGYGTPVAFHLQAVSQAHRLFSRGEGSEVLVAGVSERPAENDFAAVYDVLLRNIPHRFVDARRSAVFPASAAVVLLANDVSGPAVDSYLAAADRIQPIPLRAEEGQLQVLSLPASAAPDPRSALDSPYLYANWVTLFGYDAIAPRPDGNAIWQIYWHPGANPDPVSYHFFNHLLDGSGQRQSQEDAAAFSPWQWQAGDTVLSVFVLPWPADFEGPMTMRIGMYTFPALANVPVLDESGRPKSDAAELHLGQPP